MYMVQAPWDNFTTIAQRSPSAPHAGGPHWGAIPVILSRDAEWPLVAPRLKRQPLVGGSGYSGEPATAATCSPRPPMTRSGHACKADNRQRYHARIRSTSSTSINVRDCAATEGATWS